jgi:hypothetical protein
VVWHDAPPDSDALRSHCTCCAAAIDKPFAVPLLHTCAGSAGKSRRRRTLSGHDAPT